MRIDRVKFVTQITRKNLTLNALAEKANVNRVTLSNIKCGKSCSEDVANKIANTLGVKVQDLLEDHKG